MSCHLQNIRKETKKQVTFKHVHVINYLKKKNNIEVFFLIYTSTVVWTIEHGAYTIEESTSEVDILYQRDAKNNGSNYEVRFVLKEMGYKPKIPNNKSMLDFIRFQACASTERVTHKEQPR